MLKIEPKFLLLKFEIHVHAVHRIFTHALYVLFGRILQHDEGLCCW